MPSDISGFQFVCLFFFFFWAKERAKRGILISNVSRTTQHCVAGQSVARKPRVERYLEQIKQLRLFNE